MEAAEQGRAEHDPGHDFAYDLRLAQAGEQVAERLRQPNQEQKQEQDRGQIGVRHGGLEAETAEQVWWGVRGGAAPPALF